MSTTIICYIFRNTLLYNCLFFANKIGSFLKKRKLPYFKNMLYAWNTITGIPTYAVSNTCAIIAGGVLIQPSDPRCK